MVNYFDLKNGNLGEGVVRAWAGGSGERIRETWEGKNGDIYSTIYYILNNKKWQFHMV